MSMVAAEGEDTTIPCQPITTERGVANVTWVKNALVLNDDRRYVLPNGTLLIKTVRELSKFYCESYSSYLSHQGYAT